MKAKIIKRKVVNGLRCIKNYGIRYTLNMVKTKVKSNNNVKSLNLEELPSMEESIKFSILIPLYNPPVIYLEELVQSILNQTYTNWELCLADGSTENLDQIEAAIQKYSESDSRIIYTKLTDNLGISENTNKCAELATGDYFVLSDQDDLLSPTALYMNALAIQETDADVLYSDEDHLSLEGKHTNQFYKPDYSIDLLYSQMYICHLFVFKRSIFEEVGRFRKEFDGSQDYDLMLRFTEKTDKIIHIPQILYSWREIESSTAINPNAKPYAHNAGLNALTEHLKRKYGEIASATESEYTFVYDARYNLLENEPRVSIIIPLKDQWKLTDSCVKSIINKSSYQNYEILLLNNNSEEKKTMEWFQTIQKEDNRIKVMNASFEFNWSKLNNFGMEHASGEVYVFLNNDTIINSSDWIERLAENALRDDIGVVGPLLLFEDNTIQHAGVVVGLNGWADHIFKGMPPVHYGTPYTSAMISRNVLAVTGACMAISKKTIQKIGTFDESFIICGSDVEICIRAYEKGLNNLYNSHVKIYHLESKSRDSYIPKIDFKKSEECYGKYKRFGDPFFNLNLDINSVWPKESECMRYGFYEIKENFKNQLCNAKNV